MAGHTNWTSALTPRHGDIVRRPFGEIPIFASTKVNDLAKNISIVFWTKFLSVNSNGALMQTNLIASPDSFIFFVIHQTK